MEVGMSKYTVQAKLRSAFTLLEVLMVVAIIGLLAAFVVPQLFGTEEKAKIKLTKAAIDSGLNGALDRYRLDMGHYPRESDGGLMALVQKPDDEEEAKKWSGYLKSAKDLKDAWGRDFLYQYPGRYNENGYDLWSAGPDGEEGTDDDICNWERR